jgi:hypothetical protein
VQATLHRQGELIAEAFQPLRDAQRHMAAALAPLTGYQIGDPPPPPREHPAELPDNATVTVASRSVRATAPPRPVPAAKRGRKKGDGAIWPGGAPDFLDDLWTTLEEHQKSTGKVWRIDIRTRGFRMSMRGKPSERQLYKFLALAKIRRSDVEGGRVTRSNYGQFIAEQGP